MGKQIVILNGSARKNGNTIALCRAFTAGAESAGHTVVQFDLATMNIAGCLGCMQGGKNPDYPCVQRDDMDKIYPAFKKADYIVLASPLYYWRMSGRLMIAFERLFALAEAEGNFHGPQKKSFLLMAGGSDGEANWNPIKDYYRALVTKLGWTDCGQICAGGNFMPGDIAGKPCLEEAHGLGASVV